MTDPCRSCHKLIGKVIFVNGYPYCEECGPAMKAAWDACPHKKGEWFHEIDGEHVCAACMKEEIKRLKDLKELSNLLDQVVEEVESREVATNLPNFCVGCEAEDKIKELEARVRLVVEQRQCHEKFDPEALPEVCEHVIAAGCERDELRAENIALKKALREISDAIPPRKHHRPGCATFNEPTGECDCDWGGGKNE